MVLYCPLLQWYTVKYTRQIGLPVYCLNVVIILKNGADWTNATIGRMYLDNIDYCGTMITAENYEEYSNIAIPEEAKFGKSSIRINTLED